MNSRFPNLKIVTGTIFLALILWPLLFYGFKEVNIFYHMEDTKVTMDSFHGLILYYIITGSIVLISASRGKRVWCRYFCPMYIFNYIGIKVSKLLKLPSFKIFSDTSKCSSCMKCNDSCLMGLKVSDMVKANTWNDTECIQCGNCFTTCKQGAIKRSWRCK